MSNAAKPHPVGVCKACGGITYRKEFVNQRCIRTPRGTRCSGIVAVGGGTKDELGCARVDIARNAFEDRVGVAADPADQDPERQKAL